MNKAKKIAGIILIICLALAIISFMMLEVVPRLCFHTSEAETNTEACRWMSKISDDSNLADISIPGVHDAGTRNVRMSFFAKCQDQSVREMLDEGYRYLDMRLGVETVGDAKSLAIYHGFVKCLRGSGLFERTLSLEDVLCQCYKFLEENPGETILFVVKKEHGLETVKEFEELLSGYIEKDEASDRWLLTDEIPTLGEARGKIVLFRRYEDEAGLGEKSGIPLFWENQNNVEIADIPYESGNICSVQDRFNYDTEDKWNAFTVTAADTATLLQCGAVINFLSTSGSPSYSCPFFYAKTLNERFLERYSDTGICGWVLLDFGTAGMAEAVYKSNFK